MDTTPGKKPEGYAEWRQKLTVPDLINLQILKNMPGVVERMPADNPHKEMILYFLENEK